ncbi:MAG TPA: helix-turn-helix domain-containing protein [Candidatus Saccharimonadales bacterium]|nr:helix-turn-helix domain-containing protein [Candidatus Saccharimonadales bacterium]
MKYSERVPQRGKAKMAKRTAVSGAPHQSRPTGVGVLETHEGCIASAMAIIGNKWTALILRDLFEGPRRFGELEKSVGNINPRTLSQRLDNLESHGIITKQSFHEVPPRTEYALTKKGQDLLPLLKQMADWGNKYYSVK